MVLSVKINSGVSPTNCLAILSNVTLAVRAFGVGDSSLFSVVRVSVVSALFRTSEVRFSADADFRTALFRTSDHAP